MDVASDVDMYLDGGGAFDVDIIVDENVFHDVDDGCNVASDNVVHASRHCVVENQDFDLYCHVYGDQLC